MKITGKLFRTTTIRTAELIAAVGKDSETEMIGAELAALVKDRFGPLAPRFQIFYPGDTRFSRTLVVGLESMVFDVQDVKVPMAGLVTADPMNAQDIDRVDGAIESELNRMGVYTGFEGFEWRFFYDIKGN
jgi:hypothetical protein